MDFKVTDDQRLMLDSIDRFAAAIREAATRIDEERKMDPALFKGATELGMPLDAVPAAHEGYLEGAYSHLDRVLRIERLGHASAGVAYRLESAIDVALALAKAPEAVQKKWLAKITGADYATAAILGATGDFTAKKAGDALAVSGAQSAVLLAESAAVWLVKAAGPDGTALVLFAGKPDGGETTRLSNTGFTACDAADVNLTDAKVGADDILARGASADDIWQALLDGSRLAVAALGVALGQASMDFAQTYADERVQFERPISKFQAIAQMHEDNSSAIAAARWLLRETAARFDAGEAVSEDIRKMKAHVARTIGQAVIDGVQILGGYGFVNDYPVERYYRDARVIETLHGRDMLDILINIQGEYANA